MSKYEINVDVSDVRGWQIFHVEANSEEEAIEKFENGEGEFVEQELEIMAIDDPRATLIEDE